jgi:hypothetical protein
MQGVVVAPETAATYQVAVLAAVQQVVITQALTEIMELQILAAVVVDVREPHVWAVLAVLAW